VTCRFDDRDVALFCKYTGGVDYTGHGHRGGVSYEAAVYRDVLAPRYLSTPTYYGSHTSVQDGEHWVFLEYVQGSLRIGKFGVPGIIDATRWIAQFHTLCEVQSEGNYPDVLKRYDEAYFQGWARRTFEFAGDLSREFPWLRRLCERAPALMAPLLVGPHTVVHGEYYQHNVLFRAGRVCPVDWESAAIGHGLIDLAALTEGWPPAVVSACVDEYAKVRWPHHRPADLEDTFTAAQLYLHLRWLGDSRSAAVKQLDRYQQLGALMAGLEA
jgi:aminoglycoside phosphotransferase (APT) family kinase protein